MNKTLQARQLHKVKTVADILATTPRNVYYMISRGQLPIIRIGRLVRVADNDLAEFIECRRKEA